MNFPLTIAMYMLLIKFSEIKLLNLDKKQTN